MMITVRPRAFPTSHGVTVQAELQRVQKSVQDQRPDFVQRMEAKLEAARSKLANIQGRYKRDFDRLIRPRTRLSHTVT